VAETELLYATDAYLRTFDAVVQDVTPDGAVVLDRTAFYPTGGGQPHDQGSLTWPGGSANVTAVRKEDGAVVHTLDSAPPAPGTNVHAEIDWDRRYALMRHHTALHSMSGVIYQLYGATVTGGQMYPDRARMDFTLEDLNPERVRLIETKLNEAVQRNLPVEVRTVPRPDAEQIPELLRTKINLLPPEIDAVRIIDIVGLDLQADGGTHVRATAEVGPVRVLKVENKGKSNKRIEISLD
jgi:misacylated tRNA(Ala) deacylase